MPKVQPSVSGEGGGQAGGREGVDFVKRQRPHADGGDQSIGLVVVRLEA